MKYLTHLFAAAMLPASVIAADYTWVDGSGQPVHDGSGECVIAIYHGADINQCGVKVDKDSDGDGVVDRLDQCPATPAGSSVDSKGCTNKIVLKNLNFASNSAELDADARVIVDQAAAAISANPAVNSVMVHGYTDDRGAAAYNQQLSQRRAKAVADYLASKGIAADKIRSMGMGETNPIASNATAAGRHENRRVEIDLK